MDTVNHKLANLVTLQPDQTVGAMVNWTIPNQLAVPGAVLELAAQQHSCNPDWLGAPTSTLARFKTWHYGARVPRPRGAREIVATPARHAGDAAKLCTFVYSVNLDNAGTERGQLAALGSVTYCTSTASFWWRFDCGASQQHETASDYLQRAVASMPHVDPEDLQAFQQYVERSLSDVAVFDTSDHYSGESLRLAAGFLFRKLGGYPLSDRGGVWYLPRTGGDRCPLTNAAKFVHAVEQATSGQARFYQLAMAKTAETMELAQQVVQDGLASRIATLRDKVDKVQQVTRSNQLAGKLEELALLRSDIATFRELLGIVDSELLADAQALDDSMQAHLADFATGAPGARQPRQRTAPAAASSTPAAQLAMQLDASQHAVAAQALCDALQVQAQLGGAGLWQVQLAQVLPAQLAAQVPACAVLVLEEDLAFGYFWTLDQGSNRVATGVATSVHDCCTAAVQSLVYSH